ncbi:hypothetical protein [Rhodanobacter sp. BL-MT-08]
MSVMPRLTLLAVSVALVTVGCAHQPPARTTTVTSTRTTATPVSTTTTTVQRTPHRAPGGNTSTSSAPANLPDRTGIPACDDYLASYMACHRAANIFAPGQLQSRYNAMRTSLLRDSQDPDIRPQLATRCNSLASQLRDALHGKSCDTNAAPASTSP